MQTGTMVSTETSAEPYVEVGGDVDIAAGGGLFADRTRASISAPWPTAGRSRPACSPTRRG